MPMRKPRLTSRVMRGLSTMAGVAEAGAASDFLGTPPVQDFDGTPNPRWDYAMRACEWISSMAVWQREHKANGSEGQAGKKRCGGPPKKPGPRRAGTGREPGFAEPGKQSNQTRQTHYASEGQRGPVESLPRTDCRCRIGADNEVD
jgi:hypothetical protein